MVDLGSSVSSTENYINTWLEQAWTGIDRLPVIWKSNQSEKIKRNFLPSSGRVHTTVLLHHSDADKAYREKAKQHLHKDATSYIKQILEATSLKTAAVLPPTYHLEDPIRHC